MTNIACLLAVVIVATTLRGVVAGEDELELFQGELVIEDEIDANTGSLEEVLPLPAPPLQGQEEETGTGEDTSDSRGQPSTPYHCGTSLPDSAYEKDEKIPEEKTRSHFADWALVIVIGGMLILSVLITSLCYGRGHGDKVKDHTTGLNYRHTKDDDFNNEEGPPKYSEVEEVFIRRESLLGLDAKSLDEDREDGEDEESLQEAKDEQD